MSRSDDIVDLPGQHPLLGTWRLLRWEIAYSDGRPSSYPYGPDATGLIQYTHDGGMSACIARAGRVEQILRHDGERRLGRRCAGPG